jgi:hypothetical protein
VIGMVSVLNERCHPFRFVDLPNLLPWEIRGLPPGGPFAPPVKRRSINVLGILKCASNSLNPVSRVISALICFSLSFPASLPPHRQE